MILLDSSAWLVHLFGEPGVKEINRLFDDPQNEINISVLSIPEVYGRLKAIGRAAHWQEVWENYRILYSRILPVEEVVAHQAVILREAASNRLPTIDGLIAATASTHNLTLVHRDLHFVEIPTDLLSQMRLPDKDS